MKKRKIAIAPVLLMGLSLNAFALEDSLRCRGAIVQVGDSKASVIRKCGNPVATDTFCKPVELPKSQNPKAYPPQTCETVDTWTYTQDAGQFSVYLDFQQGAVAHIRNGDRQ